MTTVQQHIVDVGVSPDVLDTPEPEEPEGACVNYEQCGNTIPLNGKMCGECLHSLRMADQKTHDIQGH